jgi:two-component system NarL family sensor kinase
MEKICSIILVLGLHCSAFAQGQPAYARELWAIYNNAPDFQAKKAAYVKLEKFYRVYHLDSALLITNQFRAVAAQNQPDYVPFVDLHIAATYTRQLEFEKSANLLIPILEMAERTNNDSLRASTLLNLSNLNRAQKNFPLALQRAFQAAELHERLKNWRDLCADYNALASAYSENKNDSAQLFHQKILQIAERHHLPEVQGTVLNNIGVYFHFKGDLNQAIEYYKKAAVFDKIADDRYGLCFTLLNIGYAYRAQKQWAAAKTWFDDAMPVCESCGNIEGVGSINLGLADVYEAQGNYKSALEAQKNINKVDEQLHQQSYNRATQTLEAKYGSAKKEQELGEQRAEIFRQRVAFFSLLATFLAVAIFGWLFYNRFRLRKKAELDSAVIREQKLGLNAVIEAQEAERKRIARDLHDGIAQELVALKLGFDALGRRVSKVAPEETPRLADLNTQLDNSCTEIRSIAHVMSPPALEQHGLAPSLELLLRYIRQNAGIETELNAHDLSTSVDEKIQIGLYRIAQELLNNVVKHARAAKVAIELFQQENQLILRVEDDGTGFDFEAARMRGTMGILNILSRTSTMNGEFFTEKRSPQGTVALVKIPV